ncbi:hypothetical protein GUITHDRAFT_154476 [Guillardia theta CCMP2712]|uniref:Uncharacterized protein n=1 Tax=Guillardia theta (strain CCMP2712) TaxID=905079 RepID=L1ISI0_GUITC|nr:hypothetical protein GUITHDRAFT_154476 [Guillardia theta CCMP2712]EKX39198.1 hypothetical protein GUITHDRAFT_154476 [Guillardia theta CCMP2712]|eukprot:XP_005826178.1 hypothetical protein GUITHDRAFT_154476 [Guillardia theta CCMP2712]
MANKATPVLVWLAMAATVSAYQGGGVRWLKTPCLLTHAASHASHASLRPRVPAAAGRGAMSTLRMGRIGGEAEAEEQRTVRRTFLQLGTGVGMILLDAVLPAGAKGPKKTTEDVVTSFGQLVQAQGTIEKADALAQKSDWEGVRSLFKQDEIKNIENLLLDLVNGPVISAEDKKTIGTRKRYGIAADVIYGIDGVLSGIDSLSTPQVQNCSAGSCSGELVEGEEEIKKSFKNLKASLSEILTLCRAYKELK